MPRQSLPLEFNKFSAGLVTDASPLTNIPNSSLDENNFVLNVDGSRRRRLGMNYESGFVKQNTTVSAFSDNVAVTSYEWKNAGGLPEQNLLAVQVGNEVKVYDLSTTPISNNLIYTNKFTSASVSQNFSYAVVDGLLVITTGEKAANILTFTSPSTVTLTTSTLYVRDFFGIADTISGIDLYDGVNVTVRPTSITDVHVYNLRNQTFGVPRLAPGTATTTTDPIDDFFTSTTNKYPSNSDNVNEDLFPDTGSSGNKTVDRFWADNLKNNPLGTEKAPQGYFIIDALARGVDRLAKVQANNLKYNNLAHSVTTLPVDTTPGGPTVVGQFAGRVFFGGFSGNVTSGDALSPRMSSYILFSQIVNSTNDIGRCYQVGDPTSKVDPDLVDTDGGYLRVNGAYGVKALINVGSSLLVIAANGVWRIYGGNDSSFSATNYVVEKICDHGVNSSDSIVTVDTSIMYWGGDGIYHIHTDQFGSYVADNISYGHIQTLFNSIAVDDRDNASGSYDTYDRKVRWLYHDRVTDTAPTKELILDVGLKAFYVNTINSIATTTPRIIGYYTGPAYTIDAITRETQYVVATNISSNVQYTFAQYNDQTFNDWVSENGVGVDSPGYMVTCQQALVIVGYSARDDFMREKGVPYIFVHQERTEDGFTLDGNGDLIPTNQSSCLMQAQWEWSNSANSNRWGKTYQVYRYKKMYSPSGVDDPFDTGFATIVTRNRLRGSGKVVSIKFSTEPNRDCHIYGWSLMLESNGNV